MHAQRIMRTAWTLARQGADRFGGAVGPYFREALRIVWKEEKDVPVYRQGLGTQLWMSFAPLPQQRIRSQAVLPGMVLRG